MTIPTIRTPKGKMIHATKGNIVSMSGATGMAETMCGKEYTGNVAEAESPDGVSCQSCRTRLMAELAAELAEVEAQMALHGEPTVLSSPEAIAEPTVSRERYMTAGRKRHGRIIQERAARRRHMKERVASL